MSKTINGKKPISSKPTANFDEFDDPFGNPLQLPQAVKDKFKAQGFELRFINIKEVNKLGGYHKRAWVPYSKDRFDTIDLSEFHWGGSPDGKVIRGDLVLAVRPIELGDKHRAYLKQKADRLSQSEKQSAAELRKIAAGRAVIHEGYDENE